MQIRRISFGVILTLMFNMLLPLSISGQDGLRLLWQDESKSDSIRIKAINEYYKSQTYATPEDVLKLTFLHEKLEFSWDEVHEVAEQLEHIKSKKLIEKLEHFLGYPEVDPHGDPIPSAAGQIKFVKRIRLSEMPAGKICKLISVKDNSAPLLQKALEMGLELNSMIKIVARHELTDSIDLEVNNKRLRINRDFAENMYVV